MIFTPLASSSKGNAYILEDGETKLLIECGIPYRRLKKLMGFEVSSLSGCLLSHEHKDHAKCHMELVKDGIPVYTSLGTAEALECELLEVLEEDAEFTVGTFRIRTFETFHDAQEPIGFLIQSTVDGERMIFATDTVNLAYKFPPLDIIALEANYDEHILARNTRIPEKIVERIRNTHMEIQRTCAYLAKFDRSRLRTVYLCHLSDASADAGGFHRTVQRVLPGVAVVVCEK